MLCLWPALARCLCLSIVRVFAISRAHIAPFESLSRTVVSLLLFPLRTSSCCLSTSPALSWLYFSAAIFGAVDAFGVEGYSSPIITLRQQLELYANVFHCVSAPVAGVMQGIDMLMVREVCFCTHTLTSWPAGQAKTGRRFEKFASGKVIP